MAVSAPQPAQSPPRAAVLQSAVLRCANLARAPSPPLPPLLPRAATAAKPPDPLSAPARRRRTRAAASLVLRIGGAMLQDCLQPVAAGEEASSGGSASPWHELNSDLIALVLKSCLEQVKGDVVALRKVHCARRGPCAFPWGRFRPLRASLPSGRRPRCSLLGGRAASARAHPRAGVIDAAARPALRHEGGKAVLPPRDEAANRSRAAPSAACSTHGWVIGVPCTYCTADSLQTWAACSGVCTLWRSTAQRLRLEQNQRQQHPVVDAAAATSPGARHEERDHHHQESPVRPPGGGFASLHALFWHPMHMLVPQAPAADGPLLVSAIHPASSSGQQRVCCGAAGADRVPAFPTPFCCRARPPRRPRTCRGACPRARTWCAAWCCAHACPAARATSPCELHVAGP